MKTGFGRSMGRDWGGRRKVNPANAPKVTRGQVIGFAVLHGYKIRRDGNSSWMILKEGVWYTCGMTNFLALKKLEAMVEEG